MKSTISLKSLFRSPARTALTFVLLAAVSFAFFSQAASYAITNREFNNAARQYQGVGAAEAEPVFASSSPELSFFLSPVQPHYIDTDPRLLDTYSEEEKANQQIMERYKPLTREQVEAISSLPYISLSDTRYMTAGFSDEYYRVHDMSAYASTTYYDYTRRCVIEGTLKEVQYWEDLPPDTPNFYAIERGYNKLILEDAALLAGKCARIPEDGNMMIAVNDYVITELSHGFRNPYDAHVTNHYTYDTEHIKTLELGRKYVFVVRCEHTHPFGHFMSDIPCEEAQPVDGTPDVYLQRPELEPLRGLVEIVNADVHTFDVVYTEDMSAIMRFADHDMEITEGRALTREDSSGSGYGYSDTPPCVISGIVAENYKLGIGDLITLNLGSELFEQYKGLGAIAFARERYSPPVKTVTFEIVGIYEDCDSESKRYENPNWNYSYSTVFVPKTILPVDETQLTDHVFSPSEFSFVVDNAYDFNAFLAEAEPLFERLGLTLMFNDKGWPAMESSYREAEKLSLISIAAYSAAVIAATAFIVYLYVSRRKSEYAIMRALGAQRRKAAYALVMPLALTAAVSILAGCCAAWVNTVRTIGNSDMLLQLEGFTIETKIPVTVAAGCILGELILTLLFALALLRRLGAAPPLKLLQGSGAAAAQTTGTKSARSGTATARKTGTKPTRSGTATARKTGAKPPRSGTASAQKTGAKPTRSGAAAAQTTGAKSARSGTATAQKTGAKSTHSGAQPAANNKYASAERRGSADNSIIKEAAANRNSTAKTKSSARGAQPYTKENLYSPRDSQPGSPGRTRSLSFTVRYATRHIRRAAGKSVLAALLAALLLCAIWQLRLMRQSYADMLSDYTLTAILLGGLALKTQQKIAGSGYVTDSYYYEARGPVDADTEATTLILTNDIARCAGEQPNVTYAPGYDEKCMDSLGSVVIVGKDFFESHGLNYGDSIPISVQGTYSALVFDYIFSYRKYNPDSTLTDEEIIELNKVFIDRTVKIKSRQFTVAGVVTTPSGEYGRTVFSPGILEAWSFGIPDKVDIAEFSLADNNRADEFRVYCEDIAYIGGRSTERVSLYIDTEKIDNIRNTLRILDAVYPMAFIAAMLIGAFLCSLVILQASKESAIMRILGTTRRKTRTILSFEQSLLSVAGYALGFCFMLVYKSGDPAALSSVSADISLFAVLYFAMILVTAIVSSALTTRRSALELLQMKE